MRQFEPVANQLLRLHPDIQIRYCLRDPTVIDRVHAAQSDRALSIWPFDHLNPLRRWLRRERPDLLVFTERFRFVEFAWAAHLSGAKVAVINGRGRNRNGPLYRLFAPLYRWQFAPFDLMAMQTDAYADSVRAFTRPDAVVLSTGGIKRELRPQPPTDLAGLEAWLPDQPLIVVGSTEESGEEERVLAAYKSVRSTQACRLVLAPRRPERAEEVAALVTRNGLTVGRRSLGRQDADVLILDTLGELAYLYRYATVAYVGGGTGTGAAHNIAEPLGWGIPVGYGPNRGHFGEIQDRAEAHGIGTRIASAAALADHWLDALTNTQTQNDARAKGPGVAGFESGAIARTVVALSDLTASAKHRGGTKT
jgi:3-deoxy-D-manno-octulosonic-acid transferase